MKKQLVTAWLIAYGVFLIATGIIGYEITRETSTSAIANGIVFGSLMIVMGILHQHGRPWTTPASFIATLIFTLTFFWRGIVQWRDVFNGADRIAVAVLLTVMAVVSSIVSRRMYTAFRR